jgi:hypothetical protein
MRRAPPKHASKVCGFGWWNMKILVQSILAIALAEAIVFYALFLVT